MQFLIVFAEIPDTIRLLTIATDDPERIEKIRSCHQKFDNQVGVSEEQEAIIREVKEWGEERYCSDNEGTTCTLPSGIWEVVDTGRLF